MRINKFVLDSNIWISYFITRRMQKLLEIIDKHKITVFSCEELFVELKRVLQYPNLKKYNVDISYALKTLKDSTTRYVIDYPIKRYIPTDVDDDYIIALALQTNSGFVTSGDSDILNAKEALEKKFTKLTILTKAEFEKRFS